MPHSYAFELVDEPGGVRAELLRLLGQRLELAVCDEELVPEDEGAPAGSSAGSTTAGERLTRGRAVEGNEGREDRGAAAAARRRREREPRDGRAQGGSGRLKLKGWHDPLLEVLHGH